MARKSRKPKPQAPTLRDIAAKAGVTAQAVSLALNNREGVSDRRRKQILRIAQRMGYYPSEAARMLASKTTGQIGIVISREPGQAAFSGLFAEMLNKFVEACEATGRRYHIEFHHFTEDLDPAHVVPPRAVAGGLLDGVLLLGDVGDPLREWLTGRELPFVSIEEPAPYSVIPDEGAGIGAALEHLHALGHRRIAAVFGPLRFAVQRLRWDAFQQGVKQFGLDVPHSSFCLRLDDMTARDRPLRWREWAWQLLRRPDRPTAIIGGGHVVQYTILQSGLGVPQDISTVEWSRPDVARVTYVPAATAIHVNTVEIMRHALDMLDILVSGGTPAPPNRLVPSVLYPADSTGPAPARPRKANK